MESSVASPEVSQITTPTPPNQPRRRTATRAISGLVIFVGLVLLKLKGFLILFVERIRALFVNPFEGFGAVQYAVAGGSMLVTVAAYAAKFQLGLVIGFVVITLIHEIGHAVVIRAKGLRAGYLVFIPFVGGAVTLKDQPRSAYVDAQIGLAGPIFGTIASLISLQIFKWTGNPMYLLIALLGYILNLLNLLPLGVLDGGRISGAVTKWMWVFGGAILIYKTIKQPNPLLIVILILSIFQVYASITREKNDDFYEVTAAQRTAIGLTYFALVVFLGHQTFMAMDRVEMLAR